MASKATREQITAAADELFYRRGYEYTSFADIAAAVNLSRGNFYYHFKTKDEILDAVIAALRVLEARGEAPLSAEPYSFIASRSSWTSLSLMESVRRRAERSTCITRASTFSPIENLSGRWSWRSRARSGGSAGSWPS